MLKGTERTCFGCNKTTNQVYLYGKKNKPYCLMCISTLKKCTKCNCLATNNGFYDDIDFICDDCIAEEMVNTYETTSPPVVKNSIDLEENVAVIGCICFERAVENFADANKPEESPSQKAFIVLKGLFPHIVNESSEILPLIRIISQTAKMSSMSFIMSLAKQFDTQHAVDGVIAQQRHHAFLCYDYKRADKKNQEEGMHSALFKQFVMKDVSCILTNELYDDFIVATK